MIRICTSLTEVDYDILLIGRKRSNSIPLHHQVFEQKRLKCWFNKGKLFYLEYNIRLFLCLLFQKMDAISAVDLDTLVACTLVSKVRTKKLIFDAHEYFEEVPEVTNRPFIKKVWQSIAILFIPQVHLCYTVNRTLAKLFTEKYKMPFEVIRSMPYPQGTLLKRPHQSFIILYQGALNRGRGLAELIQAMKELNAQCWIVGEGDLSGYLRNLAREEGVNHKVKFWGYVQPDELKNLTSKASIGYNVMQNLGLSYYYSLANKFFDYIQAEIPQICSPFPEYLEIMQKYKVGITCASTPGDIVQAVELLQTNSQLFEQLVNDCKKAKLTFNWENEDEKLKSLYLNVV